MLLLSTVCAKVKLVFGLGLASRRLIFATVRNTTVSTVRSSPTVLSSQLVKVPSTLLHHPAVIIRRQMKTPPSQKKSGRLIPQYHWDHVPRNCTLIYESHLKNYIGYYHIGIAVLLTLSCFVMGYELAKHYKEMEEEDIYSIIFVTVLLFLMIGPTTFVTRRYTIRIYHDMDNGQFIAVRRTCLGRLRQIWYTPQDIRYERKPDADVENGADVKIKGQTCHLTAADFVSPMYYNVHLGDKDIHDFAKTYVGGPKF